jgi:hypothetical protein
VETLPGHFLKQFSVLQNSVDRNPRCSGMNLDK